MDCKKVGNLILKIRKEKGITQKELADKMNISDRTVSKWERGLGIPDVSLLNELSAILDINIEDILKGEISLNTFVGGNMKNTKYFICNNCGNIVLSTGNALISCCGKKLNVQLLKKASDDEKLSVELIDNQWYISSNHPMNKEHYISFIAFTTGDKLNVIKQYPEWNMQAYIPKMEHGMLIWYCTQHGLFYQNL